MSEENFNPRTIDELKEWYKQQGLPPEETTRFFIGRNITEPRAFGIYKDGDRFIVYKNKNDGSRAVRYHGPDEAYAVRELQMRLQQEMKLQRKPPVTPAQRRRKNILLFAALVLIIAFLIYANTGGPRKGYYLDQGVYYYYDGGRFGHWYAVDDYDTYDESWVPYQYDYTDSSCYYADSDSSVGYSGAHEEYESSNSDYSSWDSGSTDFDSDW